MKSIANYNETGKKLVINRLPIPSDTMNLVKDYLFYDKDKSPTIQSCKKIKINIHKLFKTHMCRFTQESQNWGFIMNEKYCQNWVFMIDEPHYVKYNMLTNIEEYWPLSVSYISHQFGAKHCKMCGNYKRCDRDSYGHQSSGISLKNICVCKY